MVVLCLIGGYFAEVKLGFHLGEPYVWLGRLERWVVLPPLRVLLPWIDRSWRKRSHQCNNSYIS